MKIQKSIALPEWNNDVRRILLQFWEARGVRFTNTTHDILEGERGGPWTLGLPHGPALMRVNVMVAPVGPGEIVAAIETRNPHEETTLWDIAYWQFELDSLESWLLHADRREAEWQEFLDDRRTSSLPHRLPSPRTYCRLWHAQGLVGAPELPPDLPIANRHRPRCPDNVAKPVMAILQRAILAIRAAGWHANPGYCAIEADHIHNLPDLLEHYTFDKLKYYLDIERASYLTMLGEAKAATAREAYREPWQQLEQSLASASAPAP